jgi:hypothetical protein
MSENINTKILYSDLKPILPVSLDKINSIHLVGSFANPYKKVDKGDSISEVDIYMDVENDAKSISCIKGKYGNVNIETTRGEFKDRPVQFLTSRQPNVSLDSFEHNIKLY